ncbi:MAG: class I adenylate cyclase, partial [Cellvibrionaceae bacterium]|nr:class I adenylate cyclase [Cellvibrionaceae bacterium]
MLLNPQDIPAILDRNHLHKVRRTFLARNEFRLNLARDTLNDAQRLFFDVLPALLHFNHPMLPGYCLRTTPAGFYNFQLTGKQSQQLRKLAKSFHPNRSNNQRADIVSLFAMGSLGTIAQNTKSDIDLWLCYRPDLSKNSIKMLEKKTEKISAWAKTLHLDMTIFLMNDQEFSAGEKQKLNKESSGSTQHFLLLDEFYRTALYLGGQLPIWLFINDDIESNYAIHTTELTEKKLLPDKKFVDFGCINNIPAGEFIIAAIWQLYKAISSPYKSIIKLLLIEAYAKYHPKKPLLSGIFKKSLHAQNNNEFFELADIDPYIQTYRFIENHLKESKQFDRITLLRHCFYFKIIQPINKKKFDKYSIKKNTINNLIKEWQWSYNDLLHLENRKNWKLNTVLRERHKIIDELNHSYHFIMDFFREQQSDMKASNRELNILGRKLHAAFSRKSGKIDWINPNISADITENHITIKKTSSQQWESHNIKGETIIAKSSLVELVTWLHCNQIIALETRLKNNHDSALDSWTKIIHNHISNNIASPTELAEHSAFQQQCRVEKVVFFIHTDTSYQHKWEKILTPENITSCSIDAVVANSWNEVICYQNQGSLLEATANIFCGIFQKESEKIPKLIFYFSQKDAGYLIGEKLTHLLENMFSFFSKNHYGRYIIQNNTDYLLLRIHQFKIQIQRIHSKKSLQHALTFASTHFSPIHFDSNTLNEDTITLFAQYNQANSLQVFFQPRGKQADLTIIDEQGTFHYSNINYYQGPDSLIPLHRFLRAVNDRRHGGSSSNVNPMDILPINFYELIDGHQGWHAEAQMVSSQIDRLTQVKLHAVAEPCHNGLAFTVYGDKEIYSEIHQGTAIYSAIANHIYQKQGTQPPYYTITDLDISSCSAVLSASGKLHTSHFLEAKKRLEKNINTALLSHKASKHK